ncbi:uncharacterized protein BDZ99DRAFT_458809 [Mytilinidion resinicola]|uniref:PARP catalytic domain-containing protein n=1 Tax=Mytilinidion resinicola TaxID=574789 RepID=A0A6A6Z3H6_9PEZI|nr:uncharacterized protein BDZ99DRAFT_458809 [Mytilinidion resinicola]KAF2814834.1 hypothetical protein BDZ99DRAFT_458809 [Mytilinidion resinicola]
MGSFSRPRSKRAQVSIKVIEVKNWKHVRQSKKLKKQNTWYNWVSATCSTACIFILRRSNLEWKFNVLRHDPTVIDLLLVSIHAAISTGRMDLLPDCPINNITTLTKALNDMPALSTFQTAPDLPLALHGLTLPCKTLLSWLCTMQHGLASLSPDSPLHIPSMAGAHQFTMATPTAKRALFNAHVKRDPLTRVVFHGTAMCRLYSIVATGLKVCSGTPLEANGAALGRGIYTAQEPSASLGYCVQSSGWPNSAFKNMRVLLGCEIAGFGNKHGLGTYVVPDEAMLVVRYVFLMPVTQVVPGSYLLGEELMGRYGIIKGTVGVAA